MPTSVKSPSFGDQIPANSIVSETMVAIAILKAIAKSTSVILSAMRNRRTKAIPGQINKKPSETTAENGASVKKGRPSRPPMSRLSTANRSSVSLAHLADCTREDKDLGIFIFVDDFEFPRCRQSVLDEI